MKLGLIYLISQVNISLLAETKMFIKLRKEEYRTNDKNVNFLKRGNSVQ